MTAQIKIDRVPLVNHEPPIGSGITNQSALPVLLRYDVWRNASNRRADSQRGRLVFIFTVAKSPCVEKPPSKHTVSPGLSDVIGELPDLCLKTFK
ncbi:Hypothetical protein NGAL_HAMBI490_39620 [Neorhizobium galegae bv. officinalis]|nr:Hypothetical protein NGAL_HAMBI490_39620 [Neorhizobium galegae bv. officinalis]